jgi:Ion channel
MPPKVVRILDSYATLLVLLLANFFLLELVDDPRWGAIGSTLLSAAALVVAISDPEAGHHVRKSHWLLIGVCVALAPLVLVINSTRIIGLTYLLPVALLVTATLPITLNRILHHRRVTSETVLGALCVYVLIGLLYAFLYLAVADFRDDFFAQPGPHEQSEYLYFSFVTLTTVGYGDLTPAHDLGRTIAILEALTGQLYLVTVVALAVSHFVATARTRSSAGRP